MTSQSALFRRAKTALLFPILLLGLARLNAEPEAYLTEIRLPLDLYTGDGILLRKGGFDLEVRREKEHYSLVFLQDEEILAVVNGQETAQEAARTLLPVMGTHYLRSTAIPLGTAEERQLSETGRPQYQDDDRDVLGKLSACVPRLGPRRGSLHLSEEEELGRLGTNGFQVVPQPAGQNTLAEDHGIGPWKALLH